MAIAYYLLNELQSVRIQQSAVINDGCGWLRPPIGFDLCDRPHHPCDLDIVCNTIRSRYLIMYDNSCVVTRAVKKFNTIWYLIHTKYRY